MTRPRTGDRLLGAARIRAEERGGPAGMADRIEAVAHEPLPAPARAVGSELVPDDDFVRETLPALVDTRDGAVTMSPTA